MNLPDTTQLRPATGWYDKWLGKMDTKLMSLKNGRSEFLIDKVDERLIKYINNNCLNFDWKNHILLITLIGKARNQDFRSIQLTIGNLNTRFKDIFTNFNITRFLDFDPNVHLYGYLKSENLPNDSNSKRSLLLRFYTGAEYTTKIWVHNNLSFEEQEHYKQFLLQPISFDSKDFSFQTLAIEQAKTIRKDETDAIVPMLPTIRAEANLRWNQVKRLRDAFHQQMPTTFDEASLRRILSERDVNIAKKRYIQLSKEELVNRLIAVENYVVENQERWVTNQFEQFK